MRRNLLAPGPAPAAVNVPEEFGEIYPFLRPVLPQRAVKQGVYVGIGLVQKGDLLVVPSGMFHHHPCLTVQAFQAVCQLLKFTAGVARLKRFCHNFEVLEAAAGAGNFAVLRRPAFQKPPKSKESSAFSTGRLAHFLRRRFYVRTSRRSRSARNTTDSSGGRLFLPEKRASKSAWA